MGRALTVFRVTGIPVKVDFTWCIIAVLVAWSLSVGYFPKEYPGWSKLAYVLVGIITSLLFFGSVLFHELGHSLVAMREGVRVESITLFIFGGFVKLSGEPRTAGAEFRIAIAGPLSSFLLAWVYYFSLFFEIFPEQISAPMAYLGSINLMLGIFNLIPGFPLDGGRVLRSVIWKVGGSFYRATRSASYIGQGIAFVFILAGGGILFYGHILNGIWMGLIGWFLITTARNSIPKLQPASLTGRYTPLRPAAPQLSRQFSSISLVKLEDVEPQGLELPPKKQ